MMPNSNSSRSILLLLILSLFAAFQLGISSYTMQLPIEIAFGITLIIFIAITGVNKWRRLFSIFGWIGIFVFLVVGISTSIQSEDSAHRLARYNLPASIFFLQYIIIARVAATVTIFLLWSYIFSNFSKDNCV